MSFIEGFIYRNNQIDKDIKYKIAKSKEIMNTILNDEKYCIKVFNPKRKLCVESIQDIEELLLQNCWTFDELFLSIRNLS